MSITLDEKVIKRNETLKLYITEALHVNKNTKIQTYNYHPKTNGELREIIKNLIKERGNDADLNDIDTSGITDMCAMFHYAKFNGDISDWDVSNVKDMHNMFYASKFNGDISKWNVNDVEDTSLMFCNSQFNRDVSKWGVSNVKICIVCSIIPSSTVTSQNGMLVM